MPPFAVSGWGRTLIVLLVWKSSLEHVTGCFLYVCPLHCFKNGALARTQLVNASDISIANQEAAVFQMFCGARLVQELPRNASLPFRRSTT